MRILNGNSELAPIDAVRPHPRNPRQGDTGAIHESITTNGFYGAVIAQKSTGFILAGNHRHQAAVQAGAVEIPVTWVDVDDDHALRILLADNRTNDLASYDDAALAEILKDIHEAHGTLAGTGYDGDALDDLLADLGEAPELGAAPEAQVDRADELREKWGTELGQLWRAGEHRLLCGDSFDAECVSRLMNGKRADMVLTDPPYGMNLDTDWTSAKGSLKAAGRKSGTTGRKYAPVIGDDRPYDPAHIFEHFGYCKEIFLFGADYYAERIPKRVDGSWLVWDKREGTQADGIGAEFELCWSKAKHKRRMLRHDWFGFLSKSNPTEARDRMHPTQKPTSLMRDIMQQWGEPDDLIVDLFLGSGSTVVAAHQLGRACYGLEIDPAYVAVTLERLSDMGLTPELQDA